MADPSERDGQPSGARGGRGGGLPPLRALVVLVVFVVATVLLLGVIHPSTTATTGSAAATPSSPTTTTKPTHPVPTTTTVPPSRVPVLVANASGVTGAAAAVNNELQPGGWDLLPPTDATARAPASDVYYVAGYQPEAKTIATTLHLAPSAVLPYTTAAPISSIGTAQVLVVVGPDLAAKVAPATTTTAAAARAAG